jgi:two-component system sensor histidine kinase/response regulator
MDERKTPVILVIDDEPAIRLGIVIAIRRHGFQVIEAVDGRDGLQKAREFLPDVIISDVMMPPPDGFEMKKILNTDPRSASIPFIFLTARSNQNDRITGIRDGADDYIAKPFVMEELLARLDGLLRRVSAERERGRAQMAEIAHQEMVKQRDEILQNFHHELRTPLMNIMTPLELAVNNKFPDPEMQNEFLRKALSNVDRLDSLVSDIIILSNADLGNLNSVRQRIDLDLHVLHPIFKRLEKYAGKRLIFTHHVVDGGDVMAPRKEFTHSVVHLLDNAFKYSPENGKVHLEMITGPHGGVKIVVTDEGPGIPEEQLDRVFEKFYQISQGDTRAYEGLGVGLAITRAVFQHFGGSVHIINSPKGCEVVAVYPDIRDEDVVYGR